MTSRSKQLPIDALSPGMVLSDDLRDNWGNILLPQGTKLTEVTLESLKRYKIKELSVLSEELSEAEEAAKLTGQLERLTVLFRNSTENKTNQLLRQFVRTYREGGSS